MIPSTKSRVQNNTDDAVNEMIRRRTERAVAGFAGKSRPVITRRLHELDREWDIERVLEANAAAIALIGLGLGRLVSRRLYLLPMIVAGFLLQHAVQGWCPPIPVFRRMGIRTAEEIGEERNALKAIRGDFRDLPHVDGKSTSRDIQRILKAVK